MRICIDIDGTICHLREEHQDYRDLLPIADAVDRINALRANGHYIIFCTARHMKSCEANIGKVIAKQGYTLINWLNQHGFQYDEIWFGKPYAHIYIDDKALKFEGSWQALDENILEQYL